MMNAPLSDLRGKHRTEPVPPESNRLMADIDAALEQEIRDLSQRKRITNVHHHCQANQPLPPGRHGTGVRHTATRARHVRGARDEPAMSVTDAEGIQSTSVSVIKTFWCLSSKHFGRPISKSATESG
jgi:hypothetical protein